LDANAVNKRTPEGRARRAAARQSAHARVKAQRLEAEELRQLAQQLRARDRRGDTKASLEIKDRCARSLAFRRVWSALNLEHKKFKRAAVAEDFAKGSRSVQGGRVNPR
jgi:hypothetical protein